MYQIELTCSPATWRGYDISTRLQNLLDPSNVAVVDYHGVTVKGQDIATIYTMLWQSDGYETAERVPDTAIMRAVWGDDGDYRAVTIRRYSYKKILSKETHSTPDDYIACQGTPDVAVDS